MAYYAAILKMKNRELNATYRQAHLDYLKDLEEKGKVHEKGRFADGEGGLVVYQAESLEEATTLAEKDPYIEKDVRTLELHEWVIG